MTTDLLQASAQWVVETTLVHKFTLTQQGRDRCPDVTNPKFAGAVVHLRYRSAGDCGVGCVQREGCLHFGFQANTNRCSHYYTTPTLLVPEVNCSFMVASIFLCQLKSIQIL